MNQDLAFGTLTEAERRQISWRLGADLVGLGLLAAGFGLAAWRPDQAQVAEGVKAVAAAVVGAPALARGLPDLLSARTRSPTDALVALAVLSAMAIGQFTTATLVPVLLEVGRLFEERSALGAMAALEGLRALSARTATYLGPDGREEERSVDRLAPGDEVRVRPGELVPADGEVIQGRSSVDQAPITGESRQESVGPGARLFAGSLNLEGLLRVRVTGVGQDTVLGRVVELLQRVEASKVPAVRLLERWGQAYLPVVLLVAAATLLLSGSAERAITVLVVACPTALVVAGPAAMVAAMTQATRRDLLVKGAAFLERLVDVDTLVVDKTGTLTAGRQAVTALRPAPGVEPDALLRWAATVGAGSRHPVSRAVVQAAEARGFVLEPPEELREEPGQGLVARLGGAELRLGRASFVGAPAEDDGHAAVFLSRDGVPLGSLLVEDAPRQEAAEALHALRALGLSRVVLLTGDRWEAARAVAADLPIDEVQAEVLPEQKLAAVQALQAEGRVVLMVGDGVNDALALAGADVGVAVGARLNEVAVGGADVALLTHDLRRLPELVTLADATRRVMTLNAVLGLGFSVVMVGLASQGWLPPLWGAALHNLGAALVVANSLRLLTAPPPGVAAEGETAD
jgi:heavy metal translocating P-type ATPase